MSTLTAKPNSMEDFFRQHPIVIIILSLGTIPFGHVLDFFSSFIASEFWVIFIQFVKYFSILAGAVAATATAYLKTIEAVDKFRERRKNKKG